MSVMAERKVTVCRACRRPGDKPLCDSCVRDVRPTMLLACERCGEEFTSRDETYRLCWKCFKALHPTLADLAALFEPSYDDEEE